MTGAAAPRLDLRVQALTWEADRIIGIELRRPDGGALPEFSAGAHIDLRLPNRMTRSYSLINPPGERHRYVIAVQRDRASRGGSRWLHEALRVGERLLVEPPRNDFALVEEAPHSLLIAGGIGITPLWSHAQRLLALGRPFELVYAVRSRRVAAFLEPLRARLGAVLTLHVDDEADGRQLDVAALVARAAPDTELYCCGPRGMLEAFEAATTGRGHAHVEWFTPRQPPGPIGGFTVELARSGRTLAVPSGCTILETLEVAGVRAPWACREGTCGTCETRVLAGAPDHRCAVLTAEERAANRTVMICCAGSTTERLVLDL